MESVEKKTYKKMTIGAIEALNERKGSSLLAIKKYIDANYSVGQNSRLYIKKYIQKALTTGELIQVAGKGMIGSFKLPNEKKKAARTGPKAKNTAGTAPKANKDAKLKKKEKKPKSDRKGKEKSNKVNETSESDALKPKLSAVVVVEKDESLINKNSETPKTTGDVRNNKENVGKARKEIGRKEKKINKTETKVKNMKAKKAVLKRASLINVSMNASAAKMKKKSNRVKTNGQSA